MSAARKCGEEENSVERTHALKHAHARVGASERVTMSESSDFDSEESDHEDTIYDEIKLSEMSFEPDNEEENEDGEAESKDADGNGSFYYPCPCGDRFVITLEELRDNEEIAYCPSCSLKIRVLYDPAELAGYSTGSKNQMEEAL